MLAFSAHPNSHVLLLGAHCDDIAIGSGGTLLTLCRTSPGLRVTALVLCGGGTPREDEERTALAAFCPGAELDVTVLDLPDGRLPAHWRQAKQALEELRTRCEPELIIAPSAHDAHQDHRELARAVPTAFRSHFILGYEILKWDGDLAQPNCHIALTDAVLDEKIDLLTKHYGSQHSRSWFDDESFRGLARVRGVQCHSRYAEAFHAPKLTIDLRCAALGTDGGC
jgi:LmbE family N-acetylglucosaminyl deacetylase